MNREIRQVLLHQLCEYFRLDYDEIEYIDGVKMLYIHASIIRSTDKVFLLDVLAEIDGLDFHPRGRRKRLNALYDHFKAQSMITSGRYDYTASKTPTRFWHYDDY